MKSKFIPKFQIKIPQVKSSKSNLILNFLIVFLSLVIILLGYSLSRKIFAINKSEAQRINTKKSTDVIQVEVLNGCGVPGAADNFTSYLRQNHFDVVQIGNYISFDVEKTLVIDRIGNTANANKVADALGIDRKNIIQQINKNYFLDVSVVIGKDFETLKPNQ